MYLIEKWANVFFIFYAEQWMIKIQARKMRSKGQGLKRIKVTKQSERLNSLDIP